MCALARQPRRDHRTRLRPHAARTPDASGAHRAVPSPGGRAPPLPGGRVPRRSRHHAGRPLCYGLPQLCLPQGTDQPSNTAALLPTGAALALQPDEITADTVAEALGQLLNEPSFREAANRLRAEIERMPPPRPSSTTSWSPPTSDRHPQATPPATDIPAIRPKATGSQQHHQHLPRERNTSRVAAAPTLSRR